MTWHIHCWPVNEIYNAFDKHKRYDNGWIGGEVKMIEQKCCECGKIRKKRFVFDGY